MTPQDRDFEDIIRSALRSAADSIEPTGDGLQKIRHRLHSPRSARSLLTGCTDWLLLYWIRLRVLLEPATDAGRTALGQLGDRVSTSAPGHQAGSRQHARPRLSRGRLQAAGPWMRPMLAVSAVVAVVVVGFVTLQTVQQTTITPTNSVTSPGGQRAGTHPSGGSPQGSGPLFGVNPSQESTGSARQGGATSTTPLVACSPSPSPKAKASPSTSPSGSSPTPTATPSNSSTAVPTPTPTDSTPTANPTPTHTSWARNGATATTTAVLLSPPRAGSSCGSAAKPTAKAAQPTAKAAQPTAKAAKTRTAAPN